MAKFNPVITTEREGNVNVNWFPGEFSQSRLGGKITGGSNACTLIAVLVAQKCYHNSIKIDASDERVNQDMINALGESILQGNEIHKQLSQQGALLHVNLTVPEAIVAAGPRMTFISEWVRFILLPSNQRCAVLPDFTISEIWIMDYLLNGIRYEVPSNKLKSFIYLLDLRETLFAQLWKSVHEWYRDPPPLRGSDLFVILIAEHRTVVLVFHSETNSVALIDSHSHVNYGAVIACTPLSHLSDLCTWYSNTMRRCYGAEPSCYELAFLYFKKLDSGEGAHNK